MTGCRAVADPRRRTRAIRRGLLAAAAALLPALALPVRADPPIVASLTVDQFFAAIVQSAGAVVTVTNCGTSPAHCRADYGADTTIYARAPLPGDGVDYADVNQEFAGTHQDFTAACALVAGLFDPGLLTAADCQAAIDGGGSAFDLVRGRYTFSRHTRTPAWYMTVRAVDGSAPASSSSP